MRSPRRARVTAQLRSRRSSGFDAVLGDVGPGTPEIRATMSRERLAQAGQREVTGQPALLRQPVELVTEHVQLAVQGIA